MFDCVFDDKTINAMEVPEHVDVPPAACASFVFPLAWTEHCVECAAPACHATCAYFESNRYGRCKRTDYGFKHVPENRGLYRRATQLKLREWSKLRCANSNRSASPKVVRHVYALYESLRTIAFTLGMPLNFIRIIPKDFLARGLRHLLLRWFDRPVDGRRKSDGLLMSVYLHETNDVVLIVDAKDASERNVARETVSLKSGMNNRFIPADRLRLNNADVRVLEVYATQDAMPELTVFWFDKIVLDKQSDAVLSRAELFFTKRPAPKVKCVVWDLDNTLWDGIVGEDGAENVVLREKAAETIRELDRRGILCSIASKNDFQTAWDTVTRFGLDEYFLYPQISWGPKSDALAKIADSLNINIDTFAFIDDSSHERNEIRTLCPTVRVYEENEVETLLDEEPFDVPVTEDSRKRRRYYRSESLRRTASEKGNFSDYKAFLRDCGYVVDLLSPSTDDQWERCIELFQRTNQLNASGRRLTREDLLAIKNDSAKTITALRCRDRYGEYGIVGCFILDRSNGLTVTDFVLSCRVAGKKIESAVLSFVLESSGEGSDETIRVRYVPTERNNVLKTELIAVGGVWNKSDGFIDFSSGKLSDSDLVAVVDGGIRC